MALIWCHFRVDLQAANASRPRAWQTNSPHLENNSAAQGLRERTRLQSARSISAHRLGVRIPSGAAPRPPHSPTPDWQQLAKPRPSPLVLSSAVTARILMPGALSPSALAASLWDRQPKGPRTLLPPDPFALTASSPITPLGLFVASLRRAPRAQTPGATLARRPNQRSVKPRVGLF